MGNGRRGPRERKRESKREKERRRKPHNKQQDQGCGTHARTRPPPTAAAAAASSEGILGPNANSDDLDCDGVDHRLRKWINEGATLAPTQLWRSETPDRPTRDTTAGMSPPPPKPKPPPPPAADQPPGDTVTAAELRLLSEATSSQFGQWRSQQDETHKRRRAALARAAAHLERAIRERRATPDPRVRTPRP